MLCGCKCLHARLTLRMPVKLVIMVHHHTMRRMQALHTPGVPHDHFVQAKLAKLRRELLEPGSGSGAGGGGKGEGFDVNKVGDARVGLVGTLPQVTQKRRFILQCVWSLARGFTTAAQLAGCDSRT